MISNIASGGNPSQINKLVEYGAIRSICDLLDVAEVKIVLLGMDSLEALLKVDAKFSGLIDEAEGIEKLEKLQEHESEDIYQKAVRLLETYFGGEEDGLENIAPSDNGNFYNFGSPILNSKAAAMERTPVLNSDIRSF